MAWRAFTAANRWRCSNATSRPAKSPQAGSFIPSWANSIPNADQPARLQRLAEIITGPKDGRLSRTIVNRLWARLFGRGLVEPLDDMEQPAWNQDLLDWLAEDLVANHYDLKHTLEVMLTSHAYQLPAVDLREHHGEEFRVSWSRGAPDVGRTVSRCVGQS